MILELTNNNFLQEIQKTKQLILIDFWAPWCNPCQILSPIIEELNKEYKNSLLIGKINVDNNQTLAEKYNIRSIPTLLFLKNEKILDTMIGVVSKEEIKIKINTLINNKN